MCCILDYLFVNLVYYSTILLVNYRTSLFSYEIFYIVIFKIPSSFWILYSYWIHVLTLICILQVLVQYIHYTLLKVWNWHFQFINIGVGFVELGGGAAALAPPIFGALKNLCYPTKKICISRHPKFGWIIYINLLPWKIDTLDTYVRRVGQ